MAAGLMQSPIKNHPSIDGNRRTAVTATGIIPQVNGHDLTASNEKGSRFAREVAAERKELDEKAASLEVHATET